MKAEFKITWNDLMEIRRLIGSVNAEPIRGHAPGELLFVSAGQPCGGPLEIVAKAYPGGVHLVEVGTPRRASMSLRPEWVESLTIIGDHLPPTDTPAIVEPR